MSWIDDYLRSVVTAQPGAASAAPAAGGYVPSDSPVVPTDPVDSSVPETPTGGQQAPAQAQDPLAALLAGSLAYGRRTGREDPLAAAARGGRVAGVGATRQSPVQIFNDSAQGLGRVAAVTGHGPRAGQAHETFDLGGGLRAHVYYDKDGKRRQFVFHSSQAAQ